MWPEPVSVDVMPKQCVTVKLYMLCLIVHLHDELVFDGFIHGNLFKCEILNKVKLLLSYLGKTSKRNYIYIK